jgi:hypothetical protein
LGLLHEGLAQFAGLLQNDIFGLDIGLHNLS